MAEGWPLARPGRVIGLLGGSFDPAHEGHVHISKEALKRFGLDEVWWLVSPGNPLKAHAPAPLAERMAAAQRIAEHPRIRITGLEARIGTTFTAETIEALQARYPGVTFVWLMGADNLATFHRWERWRDIFAMVPVGILARPGERISARMSRAGRAFRTHRLKARFAPLLPHCQTPVWCFVNVPMRAISSSEIRARRDESRR